MLAISGLCFPCGPSAIRGGVAGVEIDSVNGQPFLVSIGKSPFLKCGVVVFPLRADLNSISSISIETADIRIVAPSFHAVPYCVETMAFPMAEGFTVTTPAPLRSVVVEIFCEELPAIQAENVFSHVLCFISSA